MSGDVRRLRSTWADRDVPVLLAAAELVEEGDGLSVFSEAIADRAGIGSTDTVKALRALDSGGYLYLDKGDHGFAEYETVGGLTERGRRITGLWPAENAGELLVTALQEAADAEPDLEKKTRLRRAAEALGLVIKDVSVEVMGAAIGKALGTG